MILNGANLLYFYLPSLLGLTSIAIHLKQVHSNTEFIEINVSFLCASFFILIILVVFQKSLSKKIRKPIKKHSLTFCCFLEIFIFFNFELRIFMNDCKVEKFIIANRAIFFIFKIFVFSKMLICNSHKKFIMIFCLFLIINNLISFLTIETSYTSYDILIFTFIIFSILINAFFIPGKKLLNQIIAENLYLETLLAFDQSFMIIQQKEKDQKKINKIFFMHGDAFKNIEAGDYIDDNHEINSQFSKLKLDNSNIKTKTNKSLTVKKKKFSTPSNEYPVSEKLMNFNQIILEHDTTSAKLNSSEYYVCLGNPLYYRYNMKIKTVLLDDLHKYFIITFELANLREQVEELKKKVESNKRLFCSFSHELKTPINGALPILEMVHTVISQDTKTSSLLEISIGSIKLLHNTIDNILNFYLFESDQCFINLSYFLINDLIDEVKSIISPMSFVKNLIFHISMDETLTEIRISSDYEKLRQILLNLLTNAVQFTQEGTIKLNIDLLCTSPTKLRFSIKDTGIGIEPHKKNKLLLKLNEDPDDNNINTTGSCFGLTVCQRIIYLLGGDGLEIQSQLGEGSNFEFSIEAGASNQGESAISMITSPKLSTNPVANSYVDLATKAKYNTALIEEKKCSHVKTSRMTSYKSKVSSWFEKEHHKSASMKLSFKNDFEEKLHQHNFNDMVKLKENFEDQELPRINKTESMENVGLGYLKKIKTFESSVKYSSIQPSFENPEKKCQCEDVLAVDDDAFNLLSIEMILNQFNLSCLKVMSGKEAIERLTYNNCLDPKCKRYKLIFMDYQMPIMDGIQTTNEIMKLIKDKKISHVPIIGCTAFISKDQVLNCLNVGMKDVIFKPLTKNLIKNIIEEWIEKV